MDMSCTMLVSLAVATLMRSEVMARVFRDEDISDARSSSMVVYGAAGSLQRMPLRSECPEGLNGDGIAEAPEGAMSSGSSIMSGLAGPVGWRETASAAPCHTPGTCTMRNL